MAVVAADADIAGIANRKRSLTIRHRNRHFDRRIKPGGFRVAHRKAADFRAYIFQHGGICGAGEGDILIGVRGVERYFLGADVGVVGGNGGVGCPVVGGIGNLSRFCRRVGVLVFLAAVGIKAAGGECAVCIPHPVISNDLKLVGGVHILGKGHGQASECGVHLGMAALKLQDVPVAVLRDFPQTP